MKKKTTIEAFKGMSFADASLKLKEKYPLADTDLIQKNSLRVELEQLKIHQEKKKLVSEMQEAVKQFKKGGMLPKYDNGGELDPLPTLTPKVIPGLLGSLPQLNSPVVAGQMPVLGQRGVTPTSMNTTIPQVGQIPFEVNVDESNVSTQPRGSGEMSAYTPALIGQGISTALNLGILAGGYDKVSPVDNPYESQVKRLMADRGIDITEQRNQILSAYNAAKSNLNNSRSANVRNALDANMMNVTQDNLAQSKLQEQQINNGYKSDYAFALGNLGQSKVQARTYAEQLNSQSKSNWQSGVSELGKHLADIGLSQTTLKLNNIQQTAIANIMSQKYPDFVIGDEALKSYLNGTYTDAEFVKLKEAATKNPELQSVLDFATFQKQQKENKE